MAVVVFHTKLNKITTTIIMIMVLSQLTLCTAADYGIPGGYITQFGGDEVEFKSHFEGYYTLIEAMHTEDMTSVDHIQDIREVYNKYRDHIRILSLAINDTLENIIDYSNNQPIFWLLGIDTGIFNKTYDIRETPTTILFDPDGVMLERNNGSTPGYRLLSWIDEHVDITSSTYVPDGLIDEPTRIEDQLQTYALYLLGAAIILIRLITRNKKKNSKNKTHCTGCGKEFGDVEKYCVVCGNAKQISE